MAETAEVQAIKEFFFEAALATYAGSGPKMPIGQTPPGFKGYKFGRDRYLYQDIYSAVGTHHSFGQTVIWMDDKPIWFMQYHGFCRDKRASEVAKQAMRAAYVERQFIGGRGIKRLEQGNLQYGNNGMRSFGDFNGQDWVSEMKNGRDAMLFWHRYHGGLLTR